MSASISTTTLSFVITFWRETVYVFPRQNVITKDNVVVEIDALIYSQITDPVRATYEIANLPDAIEKLTQTTLRNVIGEMELDHVLSSRDTINAKLREILDEATHKWGSKVSRVELKDITSGQGNKVVYMPYEASGVLASLGGIKEMFSALPKG